MITKIILLAVSLLFLLPQLYIGIKGLKIAKCPDSSKGHIIWAAILLTFSVLNLIDSIMGFIKNGSIVDSSVDVFGILLNVIIYFEYLMYARAIQKKN